MLVLKKPHTRPTVLRTLPSQVSSLVHLLLTLHQTYINHEISNSPIFFFGSSHPMTCTPHKSSVCISLLISDRNTEGQEPVNKTPHFNINMDSLPNELLIQVATHLDIPPPSITKFAHEPSSTLTDSPSSPLKSLSQVCWRWRKVTLPILFHYSRVSLDKEPQWVPIDARLIENMQGQLTKLSNHEMAIYQRMRSKLKSSSKFAFDEAFDDLLVNLCRIQDGDGFLKSVPNIRWLPHLPETFTAFGQFVEQHDLKHHIKSLVVYTDKEHELRHAATADAPLSRAVGEIWSQVFSHLAPTRIVVAAPPTTLAGLLDTSILSSDAWAFDMKMHYIELVQFEPDKITHSRPVCRPWNTALVHQKPWHHIGYNEGSSITAYSTYEYHLKQTPKMLYLILLRLAKEVDNCCNIRSLAFFGVFPFSTNVIAVIRALHKVRTLERVEFRLSPGPENDLLSSPKRMGRAQPPDLWLEWNESYKVIASFLGVYDFPDGAEFVSGDYEEKYLANEVDEYVQLLHERGIGWKKVKSGTWVRYHDGDKDNKELAATYIET
ncbi:hypothetical protein K504DRAFT_89551 [Pleomassaria siparia CBS 279.74]|uniref:Uncharacterized protein n=1 Tax=Pleomassaria siparia CBS 279.74 TaxID=1314801 RepID=A0A6G1K0V3_9PLEO|nr:hypothetical protein K504DRAFT_89551 [Pleomassaria siparia CBS 279.74]